MKQFTALKRATSSWSFSILSSKSRREMCSSRNGTRSVRPGGKYHSIWHTKISVIQTGNFGRMERTHFFQVKKGGKYSGATQSLWQSARAWIFLFYLQPSFFVCSILVICSIHLLFATLVFICSVLFIFAAYFFYLQCFFFVCSVSFLFAAFLFCLQRFFFVCSVSFLFAAFLFWLQHVPCGPSY